MLFEREYIASVMGVTLSTGVHYPENKSYAHLFKETALSVALLDSIAIASSWLLLSALNPVHYWQAMMMMTQCDGGVAENYIYPYVPYSFPTDNGPFINYIATFT